MQIGELHAKVVHDLDRPKVRVPDFGITAKDRVESQRFKKIAAEEQKAIRLARRFDVDPKLSDYVYSKPVMQREDERLIAGVMTEARGPFKTMWIEFLDEDGEVVGCLQEDFGHEISFQFFKDGKFCDRGVTIQRQASAMWVGRLAKNNESHLEKSFAEQNSIQAFGVKCELSQTTDTDPYLRLIRSTDLVRKEMYCRSEDSFNEDFHPGRLIRFVTMLMITLNYPWVTHEKVGVLQRGKGKNPRIVPHDSYYRCRIELPKDSIDMREPVEPRDEFYGKRLHQVRGHWRVLRNDDGSFRKRTWIGQHTRGDSKLGVVLKDYHLEGPNVGAKRT